MSAPYPEPEQLRQAFRRLAEDKGAVPGAIVEVGHLKRQSLAAHRFVEAVGQRVRFDHGRGEWFLWHGHRWHRDRDGAIRRLWLEVLGLRYQQALVIADGESRDRAVAAIQAAGATDGAIESGLRIAADMVPVALTGAEWDPDPWSLGCENGVVDLRTGELRDGRPEDLITRSTHLPYLPDAPCVRFDRFLTEVFGADTSLIDWFGRLVGASFVGTSKEVVAIHHGTGNNGKSVCYRTLGVVAGDYGVEVAIETLLQGRRDAGAPTSDLMRLRGARLAFTSEPDQGARLKGGTLKRLATIDKMKGRELHGRQQEWDPTHTIHLAVNRLPEVDDMSDGFWRRIAVVPWSVTFRKPGQAGDAPAEDPGLADVLEAEAAGILARVVRGAVAFAHAGTLHPFPMAVQRETVAYRADEDPLRDFLETSIERSDGDRATTVGELHGAYESWAEEAKVPKPERLNVKRFGRAFAERHGRLGWPVTRTTVGGRTAYRGLRVFLGGTAPSGTDGPDGGDGGFLEGSPGSSHTVGESPKTGESVEEPTEPTRDREADAFAVDDIGLWDEDLAERASDDTEPLP